MWSHAASLPSLSSRPNRKRSFSYTGRGLSEGVLVILDGDRTDEYLLEWDDGEAGYLLAKQTGDCEVYCVRATGCSCMAGVTGKCCKHLLAMKELVSAWKTSKKKLDTVTGRV